MKFKIFKCIYYLTFYTVCVSIHTRRPNGAVKYLLHFDKIKNIIFIFPNDFCLCTTIHVSYYTSIVELNTNAVIR